MVAEVPVVGIAVVVVVLTVVVAAVAVNAAMAEVETVVGQAVLAEERAGLRE